MFLFTQGSLFFELLIILVAWHQGAIEREMQVYQRALWSAVYLHVIKILARQALKLSAKRFTTSDALLFKDQR